MTDPDKSDKKDARNNPVDPFISAGSLGFALAAQAVDFWFGVMSGVARASQDIAERNKSAASSALSGNVAAPVEAAKAAARTVVAEVERATKDVVEVASKLVVEPVVLAPKPVKKAEPKPAAKVEPVKFEPVRAAPKAEASANVVELKPAKKAQEAKVVDAPAPVEVAPVEVKAPAQPVSKPELSAAPVVEPAKPVATAAKAEAAPKQATPKVEAKPAPVKPKPVDKAPAKLMPEDFRAPKSIAKPELADDLKKISGVGPKLEQMLNSLGVWTFAQVAQWSPEEIAYVEDLTGMTGQVAADNWLAQAASLRAAETKH